MKAFLLSLCALAIITIAANFLLTDVIGSSTASETSSDNVRLPE